MSALIKLASALLLLSAAASAGAKSLRSQLDGRWKLVSTEQVLTDGSKRPSTLYPSGINAYLLYSSDGGLCVIFPAGDALNAYCGSYELNEAGRWVEHNIEVKDAPAADQAKLADMGEAGNRDVSISGETLRIRRLDPRAGVKEETQTWARDGD